MPVLRNRLYRGIPGLLQAPQWLHVSLRVLASLVHIA